MIKHNLRYAEFYITNVCNLACDNCNRCNNFAFAGHDRWAEWADEYEKWSKVLNLIEIGILGGEPLLNPDFMSWMHGIIKLWPYCDIKIITNGTQFDRWPDLYHDLAKYQGQIYLDVTEHESNRFENTRQKLLDFLDHPTTDYDIYDDFLWRIKYLGIKQPEWPECRTVQQFFRLPKSLQQDIGLNPVDFYRGKNTDRTSWQDQQGVRIVLYMATAFSGSAIKYDPKDHTLNLRHSRPEDAIRVCTFKICHHFIRGQLYKCGPVGILPEFIKQFPVLITEEDRNILNSYVPAKAEWDHTQLTKFISGLVQVDAIDQCKFCPDHVTIHDGGPTNAYRKKIKIIKN
jgi:organic radical activating enzyme